ncbi:hypothetical protein ACUOCP_58665, partial [Escherichia sp. R-CC3]
NSISKALGYAHYLNNPWFQLYPDIGNLSAWDNDVQMELQAGIGNDDAFRYWLPDSKRHSPPAGSREC